MRLAKTACIFGSCCLMLSMFVVGCGSQSTPMAEVQVDDSSVADNAEASSGLPLLAVPGPGDSKDSAGKGKAGRSKSGPTLLPKGLLGKKNTQGETAQETDQAAQKQPEKGTPEWLLTEIQRIRLLP